MDQDRRVPDDFWSATHTATLHQLLAHADAHEPPERDLFVSTIRAELARRGAAAQPVAANVVALDNLPCPVGPCPSCSAES